MADAVLGGAGGLELADLAEVVDEGLGEAAVEAGPEGGLADGGDAGHGHALIVLGGAGDGVVVGLDDLHGSDFRKNGEERFGAIGLGFICEEGEGFVEDFEFPGIWGGGAGAGGGGIVAIEQGGELKGHAAGLEVVGVGDLLGSEHGRFGGFRKKIAGAESGDFFVTDEM